MLYVSATISATAFCPRKSVFQLWDWPAEAFSLSFFLSLKLLPSSSSIETNKETKSYVLVLWEQWWILMVCKYSNFEFLTIIYTRILRVWKKLKRASLVFPQPRANKRQTLSIICVSVFYIFQTIITLTASLTHSA